MKRKKIKWQFGDVFLIPLKNNSYAVGQVLDLMMVNIPRIAIFNETVKDINIIDINTICCIDNLISLLTCTREQLDFGVWKIIGNKTIQIEKSKFPFEECRKNGWVGAITVDAALVEDFVNAYHALFPWDYFFDPNYLDEYLIDLSKKPNNLIYIKR